MCRAGGRRCPSSRNASRAAETARKALYRARRQLAAARETGDAEAVDRAEVKLAAAQQRVADARAQGRDRDDQYYRPQARPAEEQAPTPPPPPERDTVQATPGTGHTPQSGGDIVQIAGHYRVDSDGRLARLDGRPVGEADLADARRHLRTTAEQLSTQAEGLARQAETMTGPAAAGAPAMRAGAQQMRTQAERLRQTLQRLHPDPNPQPPAPTEGRRVTTSTPVRIGASVFTGPGTVHIGDGDQINPATVRRPRRERPAQDGDETPGHARDNYTAIGQVRGGVGRVIHNTTGPAKTTSIMGAVYGTITINGRTWNYPGRAMQIRNNGTVVDANTGEPLDPTD